jgi:hypothetical protein
LCPPAGVDPEMHAPAPDTGKTPVIPPPGSPGGDPLLDRSATHSLYAARSRMRYGVPRG